MSSSGSGGGGRRKAAWSTWPSSAACSVSAARPATPGSTATAVPASRAVADVGPSQAAPQARRDAPRSAHTKRQRDGEGPRCYALTLIDAFTRFLLRCEALLDPDGKHVRSILDSALLEFGLPAAIRSDGGPPFASNGPARLTQAPQLRMPAAVYTPSTRRYPRPLVSQSSIPSPTSLASTRMAASRGTASRSSPPTAGGA